LDYAGHITVENATGRRYRVHEYRGRRLFKLVRRFVLETGQRVQRIDFDNYLVARTGEPLSRVDR
jgi:hypothetical protein